MLRSTTGAMCVSLIGGSDRSRRLCCMDVSHAASARHRPLAGVHELVLSICSEIHACPKVSENAHADENIRMRAKDAGVDPDRLILAERADFDEV